MLYDRLIDSIRSIVLDIVSPTSFYPFFLARCVQQNPDGTVDIIPVKVFGVGKFTAIDDSSRPPQNSVPIVSGVPGAVAQINSGSFLMYSFMNGDPNLPFVLPFIGVNKAAQLDIQSTGPMAMNGSSINLNSGTLAAARATDPVGPGSTMATWIAAVSTATAVPPPSDFGSITSGSSTVKVG